MQGCKKQRAQGTVTGQINVISAFNNFAVDVHVPSQVQASARSPRRALTFRRGSVPGTLHKAPQGCTSGMVRRGVPRLSKRRWLYRCSCAFVYSCSWLTPDLKSGVGTEVRHKIGPWIVGCGEFVRWRRRATACSFAAGPLPCGCRVNS